MGFKKDKKIIFIGSFNAPKNGFYGGLYYASSSLRDKLKLEQFDVVELDITIKDINNVNPENLYKRLPSLFLRNLQFIWKILLNSKASKMFVFLSAGNSYLDKIIPIYFAKMLGIKVILFPRSGHLVRSMERPRIRKVVMAVLNKVDYIVCQSDFWKTFFTANQVNPEKLLVIENWVKDETIHTSTYLDFKDKAPLENDPLQLVFVSRIEIDKGVLDVIELAKRLKNKLNFVINVYGAGSYANEFPIRINEAGVSEQILFKGWLDKSTMQEVINAHHLALFFSYTEGYPNTLLDYILSKIPVLTSDIPMVKAVGKDYMHYFELGKLDQMENQVLKMKENYLDCVSSAKHLYEQKIEQNNISYAFNNLMSPIDN